LRGSAEFVEVLVMLLHRFLFVGCVVAAFGFGSQAQTPSRNTPIPSESTLETWLGSGDPRLEAWGAHDALFTHDQNLTPYLLSLVSLWRSPLEETSDAASRSGWRLNQKDLDERDAMAAVLDALIQMNVPVPVDTLRTLAPDFGNDVAILLARMPNEESTALSLDLYRSPPNRGGYALQYVSAALLALHPPPGFAGTLLADVHVAAAVVVVLAGSEGLGTGMGSSCGASGMPLPREDWPETGQYMLSLQRNNGATAVVAGINPVYSTHEESTYYLGNDCPAWHGVYLGSTERLRFIAEMLAVSPDTIPWKTYLVTKIEFQSLQQFQMAVLTLVNTQQEMYRATAISLWERDLMTPSEVEASLPELELKLQDMRGQGIDPTLKLMNLPPRVSWSSSP
jgi:hypothetical protein